VPGYSQELLDGGCFAKCSKSIEKDGMLVKLIQQKGSCKESYAAVGFVVERIAALLEKEENASSLKVSK